jgi:K+-transporting ATPase KdpF subunit
LSAVSGCNGEPVMFMLILAAVVTLLLFIYLLVALLRPEWF